jgi:hypothetical protein
MRNKPDFAFLVFLLFLFPVFCFAQPKSEVAAPALLDPVEGEKQARALIARLLEQRPQVPSTNAGLLKIRDSEGKLREVSARFDVVPGPNNWLTVYETVAGPAVKPVSLTISHSDAQPNQYLLNDGGMAVQTGSAARKLAPTELMVPFAGSDFWIADLGLEFLHWPQQRILRKQMRKGLSCDVLQSINPQATPGGYSRVVSWIAINRPEDIVIVHAEAFDTRDKLLKEFDPKKVEKVNGVWQLEEMEIRNRQAGTRTRIEFNLNE